jgi:Protein of unknown function (DUF2815)
MAVKNVMTPKFRFSYPKIFKAELNTLSGKMEFSVVALFPKGADLSELKKAAEECLTEKLGADKTKWPKGLKSPFRDQSDREKDGVLPAGHEAGAIFLNLKTSTKPGIVDQNVQAIIDESEFYAGCYAHASVRPYYYDQKGNKGIAFGLQNVQKLGEGDPLSGRTSAANDFKPVESTSDDSMWG